MLVSYCYDTDGTWVKKNYLKLEVSSIPPQFLMLGDKVHRFRQGGSEGSLKTTYRFRQRKNNLPEQKL